MRVLWIFLAAAAAVAIRRDASGEERDLSGLYFLAVALAYEVKRRTGRGRP